MEAFSGTHCSVKVRFSNQVMIGRLRLSLYVGRMTEYLSLLMGAIVIERF